MSFLKIGNSFVNQKYIISIQPSRNTIGQYNAVVTYKAGSVIKSAKSEICFNHPNDVMAWVEKELLTNTYKLTFVE